MATSVIAITLNLTAIFLNLTFHAKNGKSVNIVRLTGVQGWRQILPDTENSPTESYLVWIKANLPSGIRKPG